MARLVGVVFLVTLLASLVACSPEAERGSQQTNGDPQRGAANGETTAAPERTVARTVPEGETTAANGAAVSWDYVALGDSLAAGVGASEGYVERYATHLRSDTGTRVEVNNLGRSGQTSSELLHALRNDSSMREALTEAEVVTFNIGINDLGHAGRAYEDGTCGGEDDEACLRAAVETVKRNWDDIIDELLGLRSTENTIIRTPGLGYVPRVDETFEPYVSEVNGHLATTTEDNDIPYAEIRLNEDMLPDGLHPDDSGTEVIAERLRESGYEPLSSR
jgi:lysophospholipase L1-like esterase